MISFWVLVLLSTVNVGLGYALAVYLGYGPPNLRAAWIALGIDGASPSIPDAVLSSAANAASSDIFGQPDRPQETEPMGDAVPAHRQPDYGVENPDASAEYGGGAT